MWPDQDFLDKLGVQFPVIQAPLAGANDSELVIAVCRAGGLGSLPCAMLSAGKVHQEVDEIRSRTDKPFNLNFFCHKPVGVSESDAQVWRDGLIPYYSEFGLPLPEIAAEPSRKPFDEFMCEVVEMVKPMVVSFHFGLPPQHLLDRVKKAGCMVLCSATTVAEARTLEANGVDAIIAQGAEAGGHRGTFLDNDPSTQLGTFALVPQVVSNVSIPVIAAGGIASPQGIAAALCLGASAVQIGTAYLATNESRISEIHRQAILDASDTDTVITNVFTGKPARGIINRVVREVGPVSVDALPFPLSANDLGPLRSHAESVGNTDFTPLWAGQAVGSVTKAMEPSAERLTRIWIEESMQILSNTTIRL